ncbi:unknown [Clostridium sp. CAG:448]|nr:unknown [Clostridium sp. CAG:448]
MINVVTVIQMHGCQNALHISFGSHVPTVLCILRDNADLVRRSLCTRCGNHHMTGYSSLRDSQRAGSVRILRVGKAGICRAADLHTHRALCGGTVTDHRNQRCHIFLRGRCVGAIGKRQMFKTAADRIRIGNRNLFDLDGRCPAECRTVRNHGAGCIPLRHVVSGSRGGTPFDLVPQINSIPVCQRHLTAVSYRLCQQRAVRPQKQDTAVFLNRHPGTCITVPVTVRLSNHRYGMRADRKRQPTGQHR